MHTLLFQILTNSRTFLFLRFIVISFQKLQTQLWEKRQESWIVRRLILILYYFQANSISSTLCSFHGWRWFGCDRWSLGRDWRWFGLFSIGDGLVEIGDGLVSNGDGLVSNGDGLVEIGDGLVEIGDGLVANGDVGWGW